MATAASAMAITDWLPCTTAVTTMMAVSAQRHPSMILPTSARSRSSPISVHIRAP